MSRNIIFVNRWDMKPCSLKFTDVSVERNAYVFSVEDIVTCRGYA
jgi:hypothetical protein